MLGLGRGAAGSGVSGAAPTLLSESDSLPLLWLKRCDRAPFSDLLLLLPPLLRLLRDDEAGDVTPLVQHNR